MELSEEDLVQFANTVRFQQADRCGICGGPRVYIRGRHPGDDKRQICPTCAYERLEEIRRLCVIEYGVSALPHQER